MGLFVVELQLKQTIYQVKELNDQNIGVRYIF